MDKKENKTEDLNIRISLSLKKQYKKYCSNKKIKMSERTRFLIEKDLNGEIK
jgi:hypothetical protein